MQGIQVAILRSPTEAQIEEMVDITVAAFEQEIYIRAITGGIPELQADLFRLSLRAAALEGHIFVCQMPGSGKILSLGACFGPGVDYLGSEAQRALGYEEFFEKLPDETKKWYDEEHRPLSKKFVDDTIGQEKLTNSWFVALMATLESERQKGYGSAILNEISRKAADDKAIAALNATSNSTVAFYKNLGFHVLGSADRLSPFGAWTNNMMVYNSEA
ncbi:hypothetical protein BJ912DRAFT_1001170 [Pholiota molesta]|nr:hypothetical protein BJ912DRAFT_1001170 [Pholiota molesta]